MKWPKWLRRPKAKLVEGHKHDLTRKCWGHNLVMIETRQEGQKLLMSCCGWLTPHLCKGDVILHNMESGKVAVWQAIKVENKDNPRDMFFATFQCLRYATEEDLTREKVPEGEFLFV